MISRRTNGASERGSALVEFAVVLIVLLTVMFGIMDFSRALYAYHFVSHAAREGTRFAMVRGSSWGTPCASYSLNSGCTARQNDVEYFIGGNVAARGRGRRASPSDGIVPEGLPVSLTRESCPLPSSDTTANAIFVCTTWPGNATCGAGSQTPGCPVQVAVQYNFTFIFPFLLSSSVPMSSTSQVTISQ